MYIKLLIAAVKVLNTLQIKCLNELKRISDVRTVKANSTKSTNIP